jgi:hypothetical protein
MFPREKGYSPPRVVTTNPIQQGLKQWSFESDKYSTVAS